MRVLVTGCESSGTSLVARILRSAGANVMHRSATYDDEFPDLKSLAVEYDVVVVVFRDPFSTMASQRAKGLSEVEAMRKLRRGYDELFKAFYCVTRPLFCITYEQLVLDSDSVRPLLWLLGLDDDAVIEKVRDENAKYCDDQEWCS